MIKTKSYRAITLTLAIMTAFLSLTACATLRKPAKDVITERVQGMMNAKVDNNWREVYEYLSPSYQKTISQDDFARMSRGVYFSKYAIKSIEVQPSGMDAKVVINYDAVVKGFDFTNNIETQTWIKSGWNWYMDVPMQGKNPLE